jgi:hypothetical protein
MLFERREVNPDDNGPRTAAGLEPVERCVIRMAQRAQRVNPGERLLATASKTRLLPISRGAGRGQRPG